MEAAEGADWLWSSSAASCFWHLAVGVVVGLWRFLRIVRPLSSSYVCCLSMNDDCSKVSCWESDHLAAARRLWRGVVLRAGWDHVASEMKFIQRVEYQR